MSNRYHNNKMLIENAFIYICGLLFVALLAAYSIRGFSNDVENKRANQEYHKMSEIADMYASNIEDEFNVLTSFVRATASQISEVGGPRSPKALDLIKIVPNEKDILGLSIVFPNKTFIIPENLDLPSPAMSTKFFSKPVILHRLLENKEYMAIITPIYEHGVITANLRALIRDDKTRNIINQKIFNGMGHSVLIDTNGQCVLHKNNEDTILSHYGENFFKMLEQATFTSSTTLQDVKKAVHDKKESSFSFLSEGKESLAFIRHVPVEDTYVCILVSKDYIKTITQDMKDGARTLIISIGSLFLVLIIYFVYKEQKSVGELSAAYNMTNNLINSIPGGFILCEQGDRGRFVFTSDGFSELTGHKGKKEMDSYKNNIWNTIYEEERESTKEQILTKLKSNDTYEAVYKMAKEDGSIIYVLNRGGRLSSEYGESLMYCTIIDITDMEKTSRELRISEERYRIAVSQSDTYVVEYDPATDTIKNSERVTKKFRLPRVITNFRTSSVWAPSFFKMVARISQDSPHYEREYAYTTRTGELIYITARITGIYGTDGRLIKILGVIDDITHKKTVELNYQRAIKSKDTLINLYDTHYEFDITNNIVISDSTAPDMAGLEYDVLENELRKKIIHPDDAEKLIIVSTKNGISSMQAHGISDTEIKFRKRDTENSPYRWHLAHITIFTNPDDESLRTMWFIKDINDAVEEETALTEKALRDTLTGVYNKTTTETLISQALASDSEFGEGRVDALMIIDLDNFKTANDSMGHVFGDALLSEAAKKLTSIFRSSDIVGRVGGDEFMVLIKDIPSAETAAKKGAEVCRAIKAIHNNGVSNFDVSASVGIALSNGKMTFGEIYQKADIALYKSKDRGKNTFSIYEESMGYVLSRAQTEQDVPKAEKHPRTPFAENQLRYIFTLLYTSRNTIDAIKGAMELLLSHFNLSRAYVFKLREDNSGYDELFEVCADNITYNTDMLNNGFSITERPNYERFFDDSQCFIANTKDLCEPLKSILEKQEITFLIQTAIIKNNKFRGFLGYDLCGRDTHLSKKDIYTLKNSGKMLAWFTLMQFERMKWCDKKQT